MYPIVLVVCLFLYIQIEAYIERKELYKTQLGNKIVKIKNNWSGGRSYDYITDNDIVITILNSDTLKIGDSISKPANAKNLDVYRKSKNGKYEFFKHYEK